MHEQNRSGKVCFVNGISTKEGGRREETRMEEKKEVL
jgi:hypothetical protein